MPVTQNFTYISHRHLPSSPSSHTIGLVADEDEDNDICPVCDGECTCDNRQPLIPPPNTPISMAQLSALHAAGISTPRPTPPLPSPKPSLKIRLTVPQSMLGKRRAPSAPKKSSNHTETTFATENDGDAFFTSISIQSTSTVSTQSRTAQPPRRRGRPPKSVVPAARKPPTPKPVYANKHKRPLRTQKSAKRRRLIARSTTESSSSELSDVDRRHHSDDDAHSTQFPTFVSASVLSSRASSSSDATSDASVSDASSFDDSDSDIRVEEENFIRTEMRNKARVRRELLGDDPQTKRDHHNAWVIRPRKKSVGFSDIEMEPASDASDPNDDDDEEEQEEQEAEDEEETDGKSSDTRYVGVATSWSEDDDESGFDADLFFANLSDSQNSTTSSYSNDHHHHADADDGDQSGLDSASFGEVSSPLPITYRENLPFEVTEGLDGQIMFTNGLNDGQGIIDVDFEANLARFVDDAISMSSTQSDVEMESLDIDDGGYEEDADEADGDTTDEELVGEDDLPNERAMRLFNFPLSVSAINPMSTMSPSPGPRDARLFGSHSLDSPKPSDILSGKVFWDSDDHDEFESQSHPHSSVPGACPRSGHFEPEKDIRMAIIDDSHKEVPSPHPRFRRPRAASERYGSIEQSLRKHIFAKKSSLAYSLPSSAEIVDSPSSSTPAAEPVDLDDVLEASFLDPEPSDSPIVTSEDESRKQVKHLARWDVISVGAFRQTRENGVVSDAQSKTDYGSMMKSSPLSTMLWQNKAPNRATRRSRKMSVVVSPVIFPVRDGDRTPPNHPPPHNHAPHNNNHYPQKTRKESRRERKLKRKSGGPPHQYQHHQYHTHHHHPNSKSRSSASTQRSHGFSSSVPPLSI